MVAEAAVTKAEHPGAESVLSVQAAIAVLLAADGEKGSPAFRMLVLTVTKSRSTWLATPVNARKHRKDCDTCFLGS